MSPDVMQQYKVPPPEMFDDYDTGQYLPPPQAKEPDTLRLPWCLDE